MYSREPIGGNTNKLCINVGRTVLVTITVESVPVTITVGVGVKTAVSEAVTTTIPPVTSTKIGTSVTEVIVVVPVLNEVKTLPLTDNTLVLIKVLVIVTVVVAVLVDVCVTRLVFSTKEVAVDVG